MTGHAASGRGCYGMWLSTRTLDEPLREFIARRGGLNECAARFARCQGRGSQR